MARRKGGSPVDWWYNTGLYGGTGFNNNPAAKREQLIQRNLERNIGELAVNRFKWTGLPDSIDPRFLEITLLLNGLVVIYHDEEFDKLVAAKASSTGYVNFMDWPVAFTVIGPGSKTMTIEGSPTFMPKNLSGFIPFVHGDKPDEKQLAEIKRKGFPIWPNYFRQSELDTIELYSTRLAQTDHTLEINTRNARQNKFATSTQNTQLSMVNLARQIDEGVNVIQPKDSAMLENIGVIDLGVDPDVFDKLSILRTRWWNECMGLLGIDNANQDKKERLVAAEVGANDSQTDSMRYVALNARRQGIAYVNDIFGLNIEVEFNTEVEAMAKAMAEQSGIDTEDDGKHTGKDAE